MKFSINQTRAALSEVQTTLRWIVTIVKPAAYVGDFSETMQIRCTSTGLPTNSEESVKVELQGHTINFPGKTTKNGELAMNFVEGTDALVVSYFTKWAQGKWSGDGSDTQGVQAPTEDLKAEVMIQLLSPSDDITQTYNLVGAMARMELGSELSQTADVMAPAVTFEYDDWHIATKGIKW